MFRVVFHNASLLAAFCDCRGERSDCFLVRESAHPQSHPSLSPSLYLGHFQREGGRKEERGNEYSRGKEIDFTVDSSAGSVGIGRRAGGTTVRLHELWSVSVIVSCLMIEAAFIHSLRQSVRHSAHFHLCSGKLTLMFAPETSMRYGGGAGGRRAGGRTER